MPTLFLEIESHLFINLVVALLDGPTESAGVQIQGALHSTSPSSGATTPHDNEVKNNELDGQKQIPLRALKVVSSHVAFIEDAKGRVEAEMESMVVRGLGDLVSVVFATKSRSNIHN
jgi:hypothetical protein